MKQYADWQVLSVLFPTELFAFQPLNARDTLSSTPRHTSARKDHHTSGVCGTKSNSFAGDAVIGGPHCEKLGSNMQQCTVLFLQLL